MIPCQDGMRLEGQFQVAVLISLCYPCPSSWQWLSILMVLSNEVWRVAAWYPVERPNCCYRRSVREWVNSCRWDAYQAGCYVQYDAKLLNVVESALTRASEENSITPCRWWTGYVVFGVCELLITGFLASYLLLQPQFAYDYSNSFSGQTVTPEILIVGDSVTVMPLSVKK